MHATPRCTSACTLGLPTDSQHSQLRYGESARIRWQWHCNSTSLELPIALHLDALITMGELKRSYYECVKRCWAWPPESTTPKLRGTFLAVVPTAGLINSDCTRFYETSIPPELEFEVGLHEAIRVPPIFTLDTSNRQAIVLWMTSGPEMAPEAECGFSKSEFHRVCCECCDAWIWIHANSGYWRYWYTKMTRLDAVLLRPLRLHSSTSTS